MHILEFHFHLACAGNMTAMLRQINAITNRPPPAP